MKVETAIKNKAPIELPIFVRLSHPIACQNKDINRSPKNTIWPILAKKNILSLMN
jgi:hypothetical protein